MSRLAKKPIALPIGIKIEEEEGRLRIKGTKGEIILPILPFLKIKRDDNSLEVVAATAGKQGKANSGTMWSLIKNAIEGVNRGFLKVLEIEGVGYRANMEGQILVLNLGYVNPVRYRPPENITVSVEKNTIKIEGVDKSVVGQVAALIRSLKKPEPYKGKGIRYRGEVVRRKAGKKAAAATT